jgi:S1-C subfamily serine protease
MHKCLLITVALLVCPVDGKVVSPKEIFEQNQSAVVRIFVNGNLSGCGFIVSEDGVVVTANHVVVGADESKGGIMVERFGNTKQVPATLTDHSESTDTALLQIPGGRGFKHTYFGDTKSLEISEAVAVVTFWPTGKTPILLTGIISGIAVGNTQGMVFQMPVRRGYSGSPIFNSHGQVVGIVTTRLVGITEDLNQTKQAALAQGDGEGISIDGINVVKTFGNLISAYELDLISGMGTAVSSSYAEEMIQKTKQPKK